MRIIFSIRRIVMWKMEQARIGPKGIDSSYGERRSQLNIKNFLIARAICHWNQLPWRKADFTGHFKAVIRWQPIRNTLGVYFLH